jgi:hypothetical protein
VEAIMSEQLPKGIRAGAPITDTTKTPLNRSSKDENADRRTAANDWQRISEIGLKFSEDLILKAGPISKWLWDEWNPRRCYYLAEKTNAYPFFTEGSQLAIRKSTVLAHIWAKEKKAFSDDSEEQLVKLAILLGNLSQLVRRSKGSGDFGGTNSIHLWVSLLQETLTTIDRVLKSE